MWFENHVPGYRFRCGGASQFAASVDTNLGPNRAEPILSQVLPASAASFQSVLIPIEHSAKALAECSMGMSTDWKEAAEAGSTWLRIGSALFGPRLVSTDAAN